MSRIADAVAEGRLKMMRRPRNAADATYPLRREQRYRTFWNPDKGHYAVPGTDHSYCGLGLCVPENIEWWIDSGWDEFGWFVEDDRAYSTVCKECEGKKANDTAHRADPELVAAVRQEARADAERMDRIARTVLMWFGGDAELVA